MLGEDDTIDRLWRSPDPAEPRVSVEPLDDFLVVEPSDEAHETRTGLIIPAATEQPVRSGVVVAVGDDVQGVAPGDKVIFSRGAAVEMRVAGEPILLVRRSDLVARYTE